MSGGDAPGFFIECYILAIWWSQKLLQPLGFRASVATT